MIPASELRAGTVIVLDGKLHSVLSAEYHAGSGKFGSMVFARAKGLSTNHIRELRFHPDDKLDDVELERKDMEYLYTDGAEFFFMNPDTFEQIGLPKEAIGAYQPFLKPNARIPVELHEGRPVNVVLPEAVELAVVTAPAPLREHDVSTFKSVTLENGMEVLAPQFIKEGDIVKVEVATGKYQERIRREGKKA
ncbi:MAG: elongation factor P [Betaproteobacteria bacterium]|nr:elongation factor P [Betaproteobacteria bacterium]